LKPSSRVSSPEARPAAITTAFGRQRRVGELHGGDLIAVAHEAAHAGALHDAAIGGKAFQPTSSPPGTG
jgi:hypothetical protein